MMVQVELGKLFDAPIFELNHDEKKSLLLPALNQLTKKHAENCAPYGKILAARGKTASPVADLAELPFIPVRLFKSHLLTSIPEEERFKVLTSSGTTGQQVSQIVLDRTTSDYQIRTVVKIMQNFLGKARLPMLIIDHPGVVKNRQSFSARGAGILGMSNFGRYHTYVLKDENMDIDWPKLETFLEKHGDGPILLFGFTFMVWQFLIWALEKQNKSISIPHGILIHSGGWKKLEEQAVDNATFKARLREATQVNKVHNFYGMVEQVGSVFVECEAGHLHTPVFADIVIRNPFDWSELPVGKEGLIQTLSCLPQSYPGHSLLTEDRGILLGEDNCSCGRKGRHFSVLGRLPKAEARGCSDTFQETTA